MAAVASIRPSSCEKFMDALPEKAGEVASRAVPAVADGAGVLQLMTAGNEIPSQTVVAKWRHDRCCHT